MAKKKPRRQPNLPQETLDRATAKAAGKPFERPTAPPAPGPVAAPISEPAPTPAVPVPRSAKVVDLAQEYHYVVEDLQRIGVLAALMLVVLVALKIVAG